MIRAGPGPALKICYDFMNAFILLEEIYVVSHLRCDVAVSDGLGTNERSRKSAPEICPQRSKIPQPLRDAFSRHIRKRQLRLESCRGHDSGALQQTPRRKQVRQSPGHLRDDHLPL